MPRSVLNITPSGVAASVVVLLVAVVCVRLGFWQLERHEERASRNAAISVRGTAPPLDLPRAPTDTSGLAHRVVDVRGTFDHPLSLVVAGRSYRGSPGVHVLTPLRLAGGGTLLVNRGWVPSADAASLDLEPLAKPDSVALRGVLLPLPEASDDGAAARDGSRRIVFRLDDSLLRRLPYPAAPLVVQALPEERGTPGYPVRLPPPEVDAGPHLSYAVQWFAFAVIAVGGWLIVVARGGTGPRPRARSAGDAARALPEGASAEPPEDAT